MAMTTGTIGAGRVGLKRLYAVENDKVEKQYIDVVGRVDHTTQTAEIYKQYAGLGLATMTPEGDRVSYDDLEAMYVAAFKPVMYTKGVKFSRQTKYTDQYAIFGKLQAQIARSFTERRNTNVADLDNSGFTTPANGGPNYGMNSEALYMAGHNMKGTYGYNRPLVAGQVAGTSALTLDLTFSPLALEQCFIDLRKQKSARGTPQPAIGKIDVKLPSDLLPQGIRAISALKLPGTPNNDPNFNKDKFNAPTEILYYTSTIAWFAKTANVNGHGLFFLEQMPYDFEMLPPDDELMHKWIGFESWIFGWYDWHGTWGTLGQ